MGFMRSDIETARDEQEKKELEELMERYLECDLWTIKTIPYARILKLKAPESEKYKKTRPSYDVGVLLTSHPGNRQYLKASVETHKKLGLFIALAYDNYFDPQKPEIMPNDIMPSRDVMDMIDLFIMPHHQTWGGVMFGYWSLLRYGIAAMQNFKYLYCANGDCIITKPRGFPKLLKMLGDADIMGIGWEDDTLPKFNTTGFLAKTEAAHAIIEHFTQFFIPFETFEIHTMEFGNTECRFARAIKDLGLKQVKVKENPYNTQLHRDGGTWYDIIGFSHIHALHSFSYRERLEPPHYKWLDSRFVGDEYSRIKGYWDNKDKDPEKAQQFLEDWWPK